MKSLGIQPNEVTYAHMVSYYGRKGDVEKIESLIKEAVYNNVTVNNHHYNGLLMAYVRRQEPINAEKVLWEMDELGLEPDVVCYTSVILAYSKLKKYDKCWELFEMCEFKNKCDDTLKSIMVWICASTHDAEKAIKLWNFLQ